MNFLIFAAQCGRFLQNGDNLGEALLNAAITHEQECREWEEESKPVFDKENPGTIVREGMTLAEFFDAPLPIRDSFFSLASNEEKVEALKMLDECVGVRGGVSPITDEPMPKQIRPSKYPFDELEVGQCFKVAGVSLHYMSTRASKRGRDAGKKFTCRSLEDGRIGVWRVE